MHSIVLEKDVLHVTVSDRLDINTAPVLMDDLQQYMGADIKKMVFFVKDLEYISSAGIRVVVFVKQRIGAELELVFVAASDLIKEVFEMTGLDDFIKFVQEYE